MWSETVGLLCRHVFPRNCLFSWSHHPHPALVFSLGCRAVLSCACVFFVAPPRSGSIARQSHGRGASTLRPDLLSPICQDPQDRGTGGDGHKTAICDTSNGEQSTHGLTGVTRFSPSFFWLPSKNFGCPSPEFIPSMANRSLGSRRVMYLLVFAPHLSNTLFAFASFVVPK